MNIDMPQTGASAVDAKNRAAACIFICMGLIVFGSVPIVSSSLPAPTLSFFETSPGWQMMGRLFLGLVVAGAIVLTASLDTDRGPQKLARYGGFILVAALLTDIHYHTVDVVHLHWQTDQYDRVLLHTDQAPDQYRFLPQGILWWMILGNGDFIFSYLLYRFFFTLLVCKFAYDLARHFLTSSQAFIVVLLYALFYPLSTRYYSGNLLDPMTHAAILAALICCRRQQAGVALAVFVLGMFIKETMFLIFPCYYLMNLDTFRLRDPRRLGQLALFGAVGILVFFACRIPFHFHYDFQSLNRTSGLMVYSNLGIPGAWIDSAVPVYQRILHPILFLFMWLPLIVWKRKWLPRPLFWTAIYLAASFYAINLCFGWNYESRNFIPPLIFLLICTLIILTRLTEAEPPGKSQPPS